MKLITTDTKEATLVSLEGQLDDVLAGELEDFFTNCQSPANQAIHIDLKQVDVVQPEGVRVLLNAHINSNINATSLKLLNANSDVQQLLETVGLATLQHP